jgi:tetratricopeptide (TPR) repeat protein
LAEPDKLKAAWNNKGLALAGLKKYDKAIQCYDEALKIDPLLKEAWYNKGRAYALKGEHKKTIENYSKALEIDPNYSDAQVWMKESMKSLK